MKEKILAAIKVKFPKVNLSKVRLNAIADKIITKVIDDETKIDAAIDDFNDFNPLAELAKQDDTIRNLEAKVKTPASEKKEIVDPKEEEVKLPEDTPEWAKGLLQSNKTLEAKLAALEGEKSLTTIKSKLTADNLKDIPASYWGKRVLPQKEEDVEAFAEEVKADYATFVKDATDKGLSVLGGAPAGGSGPAGTEKATDKELDAIVENIM